MSDDELLNFHQMGLDDRLLQAISSLKWSRPTLIQEKAIPLAVQGKDILARARTGSGKTGAFAIPCIQNVLQYKRTCTATQHTSVLIIAPSRELCRQLHDAISALCTHCAREVHCHNIGTDASVTTNTQSAADIVIGTPSRVTAAISAGLLTLSALRLLVCDEADLLFAYGHEAAVTEIVSHVPSACQALLMSATLCDDVTRLRHLVLHNPAVLRLHQSQLPDTAQLAQYYLHVTDDSQRFLLLCALLKLRLLHGKSLLFVNSVDRCYRLKLFLQTFGVRLCVLNSQLPTTVRSHIVTQFNTGVYDIIVASDERGSFTPVSATTESGVARGIDFQFVANVVNFDFAHDVDNYIHRCGRTARGSCTGTALSLVGPAESACFAQVKQYLADTLPSAPSAVIIREFSLPLTQISGFRYRCEDALKSVTRRAVREARVHEIKQEIYNSRRLDTYFRQHPRDMQVLRHDRTLHVPGSCVRLAHVPDYIVPKALRRRAAVLEQKEHQEALKRRKMGVTKRAHWRRKEIKDPLQTMKVDESGDADYR